MTTTIDTTIWQQNHFHPHAMTAAPPSRRKPTRRRLTLPAGTTPGTVRCVQPRAVGPVFIRDTEVLVSIQKP